MGWPGGLEWVGCGQVASRLLSQTRCSVLAAWGEVVLVAVIMASADILWMIPDIRLYMSLMALDLSAGSLGAMAFINLMADSPIWPCSFRTKGVT